MPPHRVRLDIGDNVWTQEPLAIMRKRCQRCRTGNCSGLEVQSGLILVHELLLRLIADSYGLFIVGINLWDSYAEWSRIPMRIIEISMILYHIHLLTKGHWLQGHWRTDGNLFDPDADDDIVELESFSWGKPSNMLVRLFLTLAMIRPLELVLASPIIHPLIYLSLPFFILLCMRWVDKKYFKPERRWTLFGEFLPWAMLGCCLNRSFHQCCTWCCNARQAEEADEADPKCRICWSTAPTAGAPHFPNELHSNTCSCSGTCGFVHAACLVKWIESTGKSRCTVCDEPIYVNGVRVVPSARKFLSVADKNFQMFACFVSTIGGIFLCTMVCFPSYVSLYHWLIHDVMIGDDDQLTPRQWQHVLLYFSSCLIMPFTVFLGLWFFDFTCVNLVLMLNSLRNPSISSYLTNFRLRSEQDSELNHKVYGYRNKILSRYSMYIWPSVGIVLTYFWFIFYDPNNCLGAAALKGSVFKAHLCIQAGADVNKVHTFMGTVDTIEIASPWGHQGGPRVKIYPESELRMLTRTPLEIAVDKENTEMVKFLLAQPSIKIFNRLYQTNSSLLRPYEYIDMDASSSDSFNIAVHMAPLQQAMYRLRPSLSPMVLSDRELPASLNYPSELRECMDSWECRWFGSIYGLRALFNCKACSRVQSVFEIMLGHDEVDPSNRYREWFWRATSAKSPQSSTMQNLMGHAKQCAYMSYVDSASDGEDREDKWWQYFQTEPKPKQHWSAGNLFALSISSLAVIVVSVFFLFFLTIVLLVVLGVIFQYTCALMATLGYEFFAGLKPLVSGCLFLTVFLVAPNFYVCHSDDKNSQHCCCLFGMGMPPTSCNFLHGYAHFFFITPAALTMMLLGILILALLRTAGVKVDFDRWMYLRLEGC